MRIILISISLDLWAPGVRTLSACLKREGYNTQLIFLTDKLEDKILNELVEFSREADLVGISLMTNLFDKAVRITQRLKECLTVPIIWGGVHPTIRPTECLDYADMVCIGEGEEALVELVRKIKNKRDFYNIRGIWFKSKRKIVKNQLRPVINNLNSIPFADWDYEAHYIQADSGIRRMTEQLLKKHIGYPTTNTYLTIGSRGCPARCTYCINNTLKRMWPNQRPPVRKRSIENIIAELSVVKRRLPFIGCILFDDDAFFVRSEEEIADFAKKYKTEIGLPLAVYGISPLVFDPKKLSILVEAGLSYTRMGIQSGSPRTRKLYGRNDTNEQIQYAVTCINQFKDKIRLPLYDIILDNPWESQDQLAETLIFLTRFPPPYQLTLYSLTLYPGTQLYEKAKREGKMSDERKDVYNKWFHACKRTHMNNLFFLLNSYTERGHRMLPLTMYLLTNKKLQKIKASQLLYLLLSKKAHFRYLVSETIKDVRQGNISRITNYILRLFSP